MAEKLPPLPTLEELARIEANALKKREQTSKDYAAGQKKLAAEMPERFLTLAKQVREATRRFNTAAELPRLVQYSESAAVTTRDANVNADFNLEVKRAPNQLSAALRAMGGSRSETFIIEVAGSVGVPPEIDRFRMRVDGLIKNGEIMWRMLCDKQPLDITIDELGDRLVMVIVTGQLGRLWNVAPWVGPTRLGG